MWLMRARDGLECRRNVAKLSLAELAGVVLTYSPKVCPRCLAQHLAALIGELSEHNPGVAVESASNHKTTLDEPVDHSGEPARRHHHPRGKLGHPKRPIGSPSQAEQHVVLIQR